MCHQSTHQTSQLESLVGSMWHWLEPRDHAGSIVLLVMFKDVVPHHPRWTTTPSAKAQYFQVLYSDVVICPITWWLDISTEGAGMLALVTQQLCGWWDMDVYRQTQSEPIRVSPSDVYQGYLWFHSNGFLWGPNGGNSGTRCWPGSKGGIRCSMMGTCHLLHFHQYFDFFCEKESRSILRLGVRPCTGAENIKMF